MSLHTNESAAAAARAGGAATQGVNINDAASAPSAASAMGEWDWESAGLTLPVSLVSTSEVISKLDAALALIMQPNAAQDVKLLSVDNTQETNWRYSVAVLCVHRKSTNWLSYFPMLIEATENRPLQGRAVRVGNSDRQVTVQPVPSDGLDAAYRRRIEEMLNQHFPEASALMVQGLVIPRTVNFDDTDHLKRILALAARSCVTQLAEIDHSFLDNNLSRVSKSAATVSRLNVTSPVNGEKRNTVGLPVRQDIELKLVAVTAQERTAAEQNQLMQAHSLNGQGTAEEPIGAVSAYMDVRFLPPQGSYYANQDPKALTRRFVPELVITGVELNKLATTASLSMMVSLMTAIAEPRIWHSILYQRRLNNLSEYKGAAFDPTDLGVLNYASNVARSDKPEIYDLKSSSVGPAEFIEYIDAVFQQSLAISIDVPRLAPQSAFMSVLSDCAMGKPEALAFMLNSLNKLTGGKFSQRFFAQTNGQGQLTADMMFSERMNSVYNGYYNQKLGDQTRDVDLRHVDTVALMARFGQQDPSMTLKWAQSFMINSVDPAIRMANKREVIDAYTQGGAVITGISDRHTFSQQFLATIVACNIDNNFVPVLEFNDPLAGADTGLQAPLFMQTGLFQGGVAGAFGTNVNNPGSYGGIYGTPTVSRF